MSEKENDSPIKILSQYAQTALDAVILWYISHLAGWAIAVYQLISPDSCQEEVSKQQSYTNQQHIDSESEEINERKNNKPNKKDIYTHDLVSNADEISSEC